MRVESLLSVSTELCQAPIDKVDPTVPPFARHRVFSSQALPVIPSLPLMHTAPEARYLPVPPKTEARPVTLIEISTFPLELPEAAEGFAISRDLKRALFVPALPTESLVEGLMKRIDSEVEEYATKRKEVVRDAHKRRLERFRGRVDKKTRAILRNRREAHVSRVKQLEIENATKDAVRCIIRAVLEHGRDSVPAQGGR